MQFRSASVVGAAAVLWLLVSPTTTAQASQTDAVDAITDIVTGVEPEHGESLRMADFEASSAETDVIAPEDADGLLSLSSGGTEIAISLPTNVDLADGDLASNGMIVYAPQDEASGGVVVEALEDGSVQIQAVIESDSSEHSLEYELDLPVGAELQLADTGEVLVIGADGSFEAGLAVPWAVDATGADVETHFSIAGSTVTQHVEPASDSVYPIVADPWLGISLISYTHWRYNYGGSGDWTLMVYPTWYGRHGAPAARWAAWSEVQSKTPGTRENTASMRDQFYCHWDVVRLRAPNKTSWNLDMGRPNVPYTQMIASQCNP